MGRACGGRALILSATDPRWLAIASGDLDALLVDHAHCERKAALSALALVARYGEQPALVRALSALAIEELRHFRAVLARLRARGRVLGRDPGNPYAQALQAQVRKNEPEQRLDRLLIAGLIEARSHERLELLAGALQGQPEGRLYARLARAERGHAVLFVDLACSGAPGDTGRVQTRLAELAKAEAQIVAELPLLARIH